MGKDNFKWSTGKMKNSFKNLSAFPLHFPLLLLWPFNVVNYMPFLTAHPVVSVIFSVVLAWLNYSQVPILLFNVVIEHEKSTDIQRKRLGTNV